MLEFWAGPVIPSRPYPPSYPLLLAGGGLLYCVRAHRRELLASPLGKRGLSDNSRLS